MRCLAIVGGLACAVFAAPRALSQVPVVSITAVPEFVAVRPGTSVRVAVRLSIPDGWHIGWTNPGRSGLPTVLSWSADHLIGAGTPNWPYPELDTTGGTIAHVYRGDVVILTPFHVPRAASAGTAEVRGTLTWGLCRNVCVPQERSVTVSLAVVASSSERSPAWAAMEREASLMAPTRVSAFAASVTTGDGGVHLALSDLGGDVKPGSETTFFPAEQGHGAVVVRAQPASRGVGFILPASVLSDESKRLVGVLVTSGERSRGQGRRGFAVDVALRAKQAGPRCLARSPSPICL